RRVDLVVFVAVRTGYLEFRHPHSPRSAGRAARTDRRRWKGLIPPPLARRPLWGEGADSTSTVPHQVLVYRRAGSAGPPPASGSTCYNHYPNRAVTGRPSQMRTGRPSRSWTSLSGATPSAS